MVTAAGRGRWPVVSGLVAGSALVMLAACGGGADYETTRDPLDSTVQMAGKGDCLTNVGTIMDCDRDKARWRVVMVVHLPSYPKGLRPDLTISEGDAIAPYCSESPEATAASWEDTFTIGGNLGADESRRYKVVCLSPLKS